MIRTYLPSGYVLSCTLGVTAPIAVGVLLLGTSSVIATLIWVSRGDNHAIQNRSHWLHASGFLTILTVAIAPVLWRFGRKTQTQWPDLLARMLGHCVLDPHTDARTKAWLLGGGLTHPIAVLKRWGPWLPDSIHHATFLKPPAICPFIRVVLRRACRHG